MKTIFVLLMTFALINTSWADFHRSSDFSRSSDRSTEFSEKNTGRSNNFLAPTSTSTLEQATEGMSDTYRSGTTSLERATKE